MTHGGGGPLVLASLHASARSLRHVQANTPPAASMCVLPISRFQEHEKCKHASPARNLHHYFSLRLGHTRDGENNKSVTRELRCSSTSDALIRSCCTRVLDYPRPHFPFPPHAPRVPEAVQDFRSIANRRFGWLQLQREKKWQKYSGYAHDRGGFDHSMTLWYD